MSICNYLNVLNLIYCYVYVDLNSYINLNLKVLFSNKKKTNKKKKKTTLNIFLEVDDEDRLRHKEWQPAVDIFMPLQLELEKLFHGSFRLRN